MEYLEPVSGQTGVADWIIAFEIGDGEDRDVAVITDVKHGVKTSKADGKVSIAGTKNLRLSLDEIPTRENAFYLADHLAAALLLSYKASLTDTILVALYDGLTVANDKPPIWQQQFRFIAMEMSNCYINQRIWMG